MELLLAFSQVRTQEPTVRLGGKKTEIRNQIHLWTFNPRLYPYGVKQNIK
jgi:hypothetical protein